MKSVHSTTWHHAHGPKKAKKAKKSAAKKSAAKKPPRAAKKPARAKKPAHRAGKKPIGHKRGCGCVICKRGRK